MKVSNPYTEETFELPETDASTLQELYRTAGEHFGVWSNASVEKRVKLCEPVLREIQTEREALARAISREMGKPIRQSRNELERCVDEFQFSLENAASWLSDEPAPQGYVRYEPLGIVAVISPWNFPLLLPLRGIVPALLAGNTVLFKPSELSSQCGRRLVEIFERHISPSPLLAAYGGKELGAQIVQLPVTAIAFTGSTAVGTWIAGQAAGTLKRLILELGGLDPAIVLDDADIAQTAAEVVRFNVGNSGQVCNAVKRVYVPRAKHEGFLHASCEAAAGLVLGDPLEEKTDLGPLVSSAQLERVQGFVNDALERGGKIHTGGKRANRKGFFFEPTIVTDLPADARLLREEAFGPILPIIAYDNVEEAITLANATSFGLTASIWTNDRTRMESIAAKLEVGTVSMNTHRGGPPGSPWGGTKMSGIGRAKNREGMREFTNTKFVRPG